MTDKPEIDFPGGEPPTDLVINDITVGEGAEAKPGAKVTVHYVGVAFSTGEEFDASWNRGSRFRSSSAPVRSSPAGTRACGMRVGGRRRW